MADGWDLKVNEWCDNTSWENYQTDSTKVVPSCCLNCTPLLRNCLFKSLSLIWVKGQILKQVWIQEDCSQNTLTWQSCFTQVSLNQLFKDTFVIWPTCKNWCSHNVTSYAAAGDASCVHHQRIAFLWDGHDLSPKTVQHQWLYDDSEYFFKRHYNFIVFLMKHLLWLHLVKVTRDS